jgi:hypothetical protein
VGVLYGNLEKKDKMNEKDCDYELKTIRIELIRPATDSNLSFLMKVRMADNEGTQHVMARIDDYLQISYPDWTVSSIIFQNSL